MTRPRKTARFTCIGGPRDGSTARVRVEQQTVLLDGELYHRMWWVQRDAEGKRLWERECLVWLVTARGDDPKHPQVGLEIE